MPDQTKLPMCATENIRTLPPVIPRIVSVYCRRAGSGASYSWHSHPFYELALVTEDATKIGYPAGERQTGPNTLLFYHPGELHGAWSTPQQAPSYWVLHFAADPSVCLVLGLLATEDSRQRVWQLTSSQSETFKWLFLQILNEQTQQKMDFALAQSSWLQLLLVSIHRWAIRESPLVVSREMLSPELLRLWHLVNTSADRPMEMLHRIRLLPNYDSLRHSFRRVFGCPPREMMLRLKMQHAQDLLVESSLSIKEIAARTGYARQHEFSRAFRQRMGLTPSEWRRSPLLSEPANSNLEKSFSDTAKDGGSQMSCNGIEILRSAKINERDTQAAATD
ncbi:MAG TPA: helix-turn-helix transcriptional regulator [Terriglobales bacterium]|nr:helix-turn-helix transcriptional regulator [Terriglobales bacterium]